MIIILLFIGSSMSLFNVFQPNQNIIMMHIDQEEITNRALLMTPALTWYTGKLASLNRSWHTLLMTPLTRALTWLVLVYRQASFIKPLAVYIGNVL
jgi:hypothetical protein